MNASNKLCEELLCRYSDFEPIEGNKFTGYKLAEKKNLNYYSAVTGLFRYKARSVSDNSYSSLYEKHGIFYDPIMKDKISVFRKKEDAINFLNDYIHYRVCHEINGNERKLKSMFSSAFDGEKEKSYSSEKSVKTFRASVFSLKNEVIPKAEPGWSITDVEDIDWLGELFEKEINFISDLADFLKNKVPNFKIIFRRYPSKGKTTIEMETLSIKPLVLSVPGFILEDECDHIIEMGTKVIRESMVGQGGGFKSKTRTSRNGWLRRSASPTLERIYKRFGDVLGIDHELLSSNRNAEELQVVRYQQSQEYAPHHDFGDDGTPEQRFLTLLLYIQLPDKGGATSFPKAADGRGLQVVPARGDAVLFYSMLPDGNADDLSLHACMPIHEGEKCVCNLWVWDPHRHGH